MMIGSEGQSVPAAVVVPAGASASAPTLRVRNEAALPSQAVLGERARALGVHPLLVRMLVAREVAEAEHAAFLTSRLGQLRPPHAMAGFDAALDLLVGARRDRVRVGVFGDYDVDGVTTAAILTTYLEAVGLEVVARVAHRDQGYGLGVPDAEAFAEVGCGMVVTGDVGTSDLEAIAWLGARGIKTVVIDHHQVPTVSPPANAFINPHQPGCGFPFKGLCSAGVAFYLCAALRSRLVAAGEDAPDPRSWLDLVAVATVCDMMPLHAENRVLVRAGLRRLGQGGGRPGLRALLRMAKVADDEPVTAEHLGFKLGPRLNAPGRLGTAEPALRLLRASSAAEALPLAEHIEMLNERRRRHTQTTVAEAMAVLECDSKLADRYALVVAHEHWLPGVVGIAAAQIAEHHRRPAAVLAIDARAALARGSVRSFGGVDVRRALADCGSLLERFGGHREAAGLSLAAANVPAFAEAFDAACFEQRPERAATQDTEDIDAVLPLSACSEAFGESVQGLGPFGVGFAPPRFAATDLRVERVRVLKERHLSLTLAQGEDRREAIAFGQAWHQIATGEHVGCIFVPIFDRFRGVTRLRMQLERLWRMP